MRRFRYSFSIIPAVAFAMSMSLLAAAALAADDAPRPNIVFLFADDLGYGDLACYGAPDVRTPNLDRLAKAGVRFTQHYSNGPECTPTRTGLMTGRYQQRVGGMECAIGIGNVGRYDDAIRLAEQHQLGLPVADAVLPRAIKQAGYATAIVGKWHLGYDDHFNPLNHGFDHFFGCLGGNVDYFTHRELSTLPVLYSDRKPIERDGYMTHLIADEAIAFLRREHRQPFFLYVPFTTPHFPFQGPGDAAVPLADDAWTKGTRAKYVEMVEDMDTQIGRILSALKESGRERNTLVVFASDNGAMAPGRNLPMANYKGTVYEGGIRVPLIVAWPDHVPAGTVSRQVCITMDLTRSFIRIAGGREPADQPLDGIDIIARVEQQQPDIPRTLFWRYRRGEKTDRAVRDGNLKYLHRQSDDGAVEERLFDLSADEGETNDLLGDRVADAKRLKQLLAGWEVNVRASR
jgi:arylsulfatase A